jgi:hypothetical protein
MFFFKKKKGELSYLSQQMEDGQAENEKQVQGVISKLKVDVKKIQEFLSTDLRLTKYGSEDKKITVENIEDQEDKKYYLEWLEQQA